MARVTVEDCLDHVENRFELVMLASKRARQIATGRKDALVPEENDKPTVIALREIAENLLTEEVLAEPQPREEDEFGFNLKETENRDGGRDDVAFE